MPPTRRQRGEQKPPALIAKAASTDERCRPQSDGALRRGGCGDADESADDEDEAYVRHVWKERDPGSEVLT